jgi:hypothetical protein
VNVWLDHLVVAAATLDQGAAWCEATLGVTPGPGGRHALMGTHNRLLKISSPAFPDSYLEIIAIDPEAAAPTRPRWFGLDDPALQARLAAEGPRLIHSVARSPQLDMHRWGLIAVGHQPGEPVRAGRDTPQGRLEWEILLRPDGALQCGGALPTLLQWHGRHPTADMADSGVALSALTLCGFGERARDVLRVRGVKVLPLPAADAAERPPALRAVLQTPRGEVELGSA